MSALRSARSLRAIMAVMLFSLGYSPGARAQGSENFGPSDFVVAVVSHGPIAASGGDFTLHSPTGLQKSIVASSGGSPPKAVAVDQRTGRLLMVSGDDRSVLRVKDRGVSQTPAIYRAGEGRQIASIAVGQGGSIYLAEVELCPYCDSVEDFFTLVRLNALGVPQSTFRVPSIEPDFIRPLPQIEIDQGECVLYYSEGTRRIRRYDLCQRMALADLISALPGSAAFDIRRLRDGSILVANAEFLVPVSRTGEILQIIPRREVEFRKLSIAARGSIVYSGFQEKIVRIDLDDLARQQVIDLQPVFRFRNTIDFVSLEEFDDSSSRIPTLDVFSMICMTLLIAGTALWVLHK